VGHSIIVGKLLPVVSRIIFSLFMMAFSMLLSIIELQAFPLLHLDFLVLKYVFEKFLNIFLEEVGDVSSKL